MDALRETRTKINGKFLADFNGKPVSLLGKVIKVHTNGMMFELKTTDNMVVNVNLNQPVMDLIEGWVEVRGNGQGKSSIMAQHYLPLSESAMANFDAGLYDDLICIINTVNNPWVNL